MYKTGIAWAEENAKYKHDVHIERDGVNLYGEFYDFGSDKCAFIMSGRTEALKYSYYFAIPYAKNGYNVLVVDPRAHGLSDGEFNTVGFEESKDAIAWINHIVTNFNVKSVVMHGICIGAAGSVIASTSKDAPSVIKGLVVEGMFCNFAESVKNHLIERKKPVFIMLDLINNQMKKHTGYSMKIGPIDYVDKLDKPLLMLHSKEDKYSTPKKAVELYEKAGSKDKKLVWFEKGDHSMLRITDTEKYDNEITEFLTTLN
jgi:alpha-beta hydrolase superfamily lysophospholipase